MEGESIKPGVLTSEFWLTAIVNLGAAVLLYLQVTGAVSVEESDAVLQIVQALANLLVPLLLAVVNVSYIRSRTLVKAGRPG